MRLHRHLRARTTRARTGTGIRTDVADLVRELGPTLLRYPGGNFVSSYKWEDGVGPREDRPTRLDLAWRAIEPNEFGLNEFVPWARSVGAEPMMAVNLGTRGVHEAMRPPRVRQPPRRHATCRTCGPRTAPRSRTTSKLWCLGNELDGPWQMGSKTAHEYGRLAHETAKAMRMVDPSIELVAVGSSNHQMPTFGCVGARPSSSTPTTRSTTSRCTPTTRSTTATAPASSPAPPTWTRSSTRWSRSPTRSVPRPGRGRS